MKRVILKSIIFILIFFVLWSFVSALVVNVDRDGYINISEFYQQQDDSLDAVYIGASTGFLYWNSAIAWNEYGITVYPYSCNANTFFSTKYIIEEARKSQPDTKFIVNVNSLTDDELSVMSMHNIINCMPFSLTKLKMIDHLCDMGDYEGKDRAEFYFPLIRFHQAWPDLYFTSKIDLGPTGYKGASIFYRYLEESVDVTDLYVAPEKNIELSEKIVSSTESLLSYCDEENIEVVFVVVPQARDNQYEMDRLRTFADFISDKGYTVLDFSENFDEEINLDMTKDYFDGRHTNIHGSIKFTHYLSKYLIDEYGFEDKRENEEYSDWHTSYESYMQVASSHILDFELDYAHRDFSLEEPDFEVEVKDNNAKISIEAVEDSQGYLVYRKDGANTLWENIVEISAEDIKKEYIDKNLTKGTNYHYTVVPYLIKDGERYYGDFNYSGKSVTP